MASATDKSQPKNPSSPSEYACSNLEAFPIESPPKTPPPSDFLDLLLELDSPHTPTALNDWVTVEVLDDTPQLPPPNTSDKSINPVTPLHPNQVDKSTEERKKGPVQEKPLLKKLFEASDAFHSLQRRVTQSKASKPRVRSLPDKRSLAIQETHIRKNKQVKGKNNKKEKEYTCEICSLEIKGTVQWYEHLEGKKHKKKVKNLDIPNCEICNLPFASPEDRKNHLSSSNHRENRTFGAHSAYKQVVKRN